MYSRAEFDHQREIVKDVSRREGRLLAAVAVGLGVAQLVFMRFAEPRCGQRLQGLSERIASATGRCDSCGGQVIA